MLKLHKEAFPFVLYLLLFFGVSSFLVEWLLADFPWLQIVLYVFNLVCVVLVLQFFRNPDRDVAKPNSQHVLAPADGKVVVIEEVEEPEFFGDRRVQVSIFMSPLNVHVNRHPLSGKIIYQKYHPGKFLVAWNPKSSTDNERTTVVYESLGNKLLLRQIAGFMARRIICYAKEGQPVRQGDDMGFIRFGSRVDLLLPLDAKISVNIGDKVVGNRTVVAELS